MSALKWMRNSRIDRIRNLPGLQYHRYLALHKCALSIERQKDEHPERETFVIQEKFQEQETIFFVFSSHLDR